MDSASTRHLAILLAAILSGAAAPPPASPVAPRHQDAPVHQAQVEARIVAAPQPVRGSDGARHLAYELRITSFQSDTDPLTLVRIAIYADDARTPLETLDGAAIGTLLAQPPQEDDPKDGVPIASGRSKTFFLWLTLPAGIPPRALRHQLVFRTGAGALQRADDIRTPVIEAAPVRIAAPLRGGRWLAAEGPGNRLSHHWGSMVAINGTLSDPQRFAIDWFGLDDGDHAFRGPRASPAATTDEDWIGYGGDVLAVADGWWWMRATASRTARRWRRRTRPTISPTGRSTAISSCCGSRRAATPIMPICDPAAWRSGSGSACGAAR